MNTYVFQACSNIELHQQFTNWETAQAVADKYNWVLIGELVDVVEWPDMPEDWNVSEQ